MQWAEPADNLLVVRASRVRRCGRSRPYVMRRKLPNLAAIVSLLLCVAVCVLWVRSYRVGNYGEFVGVWK